MDDKERLKSLRAELEGLQGQLEGLRDVDENIMKSASKSKRMKPFIPVPKVRRLLKGHFGKIYSLTWSDHFDGKEDDRILGSVSQDGKLIVWNGQTNEKLQTVYLRSSWVMTCCLEPSEGKLIACGGLDNVCMIYTLSAKSDSRISRELRAHEAYISCVKFFDESSLVTSSGDFSCIYWDIEEERPVHTFKEHTNDVMSVSINPQDSNVFISGSVDTLVKVWDIRQENSVASCAGQESDINSVQYLPSGTTFCSGSDDNTCMLFDMRCFCKLAGYTSTRITVGVSSVAASKSGRLIFAGYDDSICRVWDICKEDDALWELKGHEARVSCVGVNKSGSAVATGSWDTTLRIWS